MAENIEDQETDFTPEEPRGVGPQLRAAREAKGLSIEQVAAETRISQRHLTTIEEGQFADLPGRTYAVGFAKNYAKVVGLNQNDVAEMVRAELEAQTPQDQYRPKSFEPGDPARVPSARLGWFALFALVLLLVGGFFFVRTLFSPAAELPSLVEERQPQEAQQQAQATQQPAPAPTDGPVVFTALDGPVWVKFYDGSGNQLMQKEMAKGESYTVPPNASQPMIWTGRPEALSISIGGQRVPKLAEEQTTMKDIPVTAEALLARGGGQGEASQTAAPTAQGPSGT